MLHISLVQLESIYSSDPHCKEKNFQKIGDLLKNTHRGPDHLIVLPEMFATGYLPQKPADFAEDLSNVKASKTARFLKSLADEKNAFVLGAAISKCSGNSAEAQESKEEHHEDSAGIQGEREGILDSSQEHNSQIYNQSGLFTPKDEGGVLFYNKQKLFFPEVVRNFTAGDRISLFKIADFTVAVFICYDLRFPELFRRAVQQGADLFVIQAAWPLAREKHWETLLQARAIENQVYVAAVNGVSPTENDSKKKLAGNSLIIDPKGEIIARGSSHKEEIVSAAIQKEPLEKYRKEFPVLKGIAPDVF